MRIIVGGAVLLSAAAASLAIAQQTPPPAAQPAPAPVPAAPSPASEAPPPIAVIPLPPAPAAAPAVVTPAPEAPAPTKPAIAPKPDEPLKRGRSGVAIMQALDKITAETMRFEAPVGQPIRYKNLIFTVRACETSAPDEVSPDATAYVQVVSQSRDDRGRPVGPVRDVFRGWMYASSPGVRPLEHPVYDAWLIACKASAAPAPAGKR
ncbi:DUF2155 domain-containing protein [Caulobacter sp. NIBR2454]|uniref:DUF2155 domain-containing protein n=1 Tax=Caulobacter sp. NIBR2454 TaxID=3015996 RepID=UPI0022B6BA56|nr:DUF2155 domain-containing protein [Caulobacter sp. NIBR2454]